MRLGINLDINTDYTTGGWTDVSRLFTGWYNCQHYNADGYPLDNGAQCQSHMLGTAAGTYKLSFDGTAALTPSWGPTLASIAKSGSTTTADLIVPHANCLMMWTVTGLNNADQFRNLHIYAPGSTATSPTFRPEWTKWLKPFTVVRSIDWACVNVSNGDISANPALKTNPVAWSNRVAPTSWDQTSRGVAYEYFLTLAQQAGIIPWINVPYMADDDYVRSLAKLCATYNLPVQYVEVGNENWNNGFGQWRQNYDAANNPPNMAVDGDISTGSVVAYPGGQPGTNGNVRANRLAAERARHVGNIFRDVLGSHRVRIVLGGQHMNPQVATDGLAWVAAKYGDTDRAFDVLAIAPYFPISQPAAQGATLQSIAASAQAFITGDCASFIKQHKLIADKYGLSLVGYEGGQSYFPWSDPPGGPGDLPTLLQTDPLMGQLYQAWLGVCAANGISLLNHCSFMRPWVKGGLFALQQDVTDVPGQKWTALANYNQADPVIIAPSPAPAPAPVPPTLAGTISYGGQNYSVAVTLSK